MKSLSVYNFENKLDTIEEIEEIISKMMHVPPSGLDKSSSGFIPFFNDVNILEVKTESFKSFSGKVKISTKMLPASVIKEFLDDEIKRILIEENRNVGKKEKAELKEKITDNLLPKAFVKNNVISFSIVHDFVENKKYILIDSISENTTGIVLRMLLENIKNNEEVGLSRLQAELPVASTITKFIKEDFFNDLDINNTNIMTGTNCTININCNQEVPSIVKVDKINLESEDVLHHLQTENNLITKISLVLNKDMEDEIPFVLDEKLNFSGIKIKYNKVDDEEHDEHLLKLKAREIIMINELLKLINSVYYNLLAS